MSQTLLVVSQANAGACTAGGVVSIAHARAHIWAAEGEPVAARDGALADHGCARRVPTKAAHGDSRAQPIVQTVASEVDVNGEVIL